MMSPKISPVERLRRSPENARGSLLRGNVPSWHFATLCGNAAVGRFRRKRTKPPPQGLQTASSKRCQTAHEVTSGRLAAGVVAGPRTRSSWSAPSPLWDRRGMVRRRRRSGRRRRIGGRPWVLQALAPPANCRRRIFRRAGDYRAGALSSPFRLLLTARLSCGNQSDREAPWEKFRGIVDGLLEKIAVPGADDNLHRASPPRTPARQAQE
jgi:hypothetical protein